LAGRYDGFPAFSVLPLPGAIGTPGRPGCVQACAHWSQFHFTAGGTRFNPYEKTINVKNVHRLHLHWRYNTGLYVYSSPSVVNGVVYVASYNGNVYAINASNGKKLWSYATGGAILGSPAVANGLVYIGSTDSKLYAVKVSDGSLAWSLATDQEQSSPAASDEVVYVGDDFDDLYALNGTTGAVIWSDQGGGEGVHPLRSQMERSTMAPKIASMP
jgi:outer membrane protein assembly factor BamB